MKSKENKEHKNLATTQGKGREDRCLNTQTKGTGGKDSTQEQALNHNKEVQKVRYDFQGTLQNFTFLTFLTKVRNMAIIIAEVTKCKTFPPVLV